jgi:phage terminase large subunit-like protein
MYSDKSAEQVINFIQSQCVQSKYPWTGQKVKLLDWQVHDILRPLYGTLLDNGQRQYKRAGIWVGKKNGKSTLMSCLCLFHIFEQPGSEIYCLASTVEQAKCVFNETAAMVENNPVLSKRLWVRRNLNTIEYKKEKSIIKILSSDHTSKSGVSANLVVYDELSSWGSHGRDVWDRMQGATAARVNSLQIVISTAEYDKTTIGYEQYSLAKKIKANPDLDSTFLPVIYECPEHADWKDETNWELANPSMGVTVPKQFYYDEYRTTKNNPLAEANFRTRYLNQWVGHGKAWIASNVWESCGEHWDEKDFHGQRVYVGIDFARKNDLLAYVILTERNGNLYLMPRFFIPEEGATRKEHYDNVPYSQWSRMPVNLTLTPGDVIDPSYLIKSLVVDASKFRFAEVGFDPNGFEVIRQELEFKHGLRMVEVPQTYKYMSPATSEFERRCLAHTLRHPCNPILSWNLENCAVRESNDQILIEKSAAAKRVDGITASIIAMSRYMGNQQTGRVIDRNLAIFV